MISRSAIKNVQF